MCVVCVCAREGQFTWDSLRGTVYVGQENICFEVNMFFFPLCSSTYQLHSSKYFM